MEKQIIKTFMGIFNFLKPKKNESEIIKKIFPNLKGIHFESISTTPKGDSPKIFLILILMENGFFQFIIL